MKMVVFSESERQALMLKTKLLQRQLDKEMYGEAWAAERDRLAGDQKALEALEKRQKLEFEKQMKLRLLNTKKSKEFEVEITDLEGDMEIVAQMNGMEEKLTADWVKKEMDQEEWRKMSEKERQALLMKAKLAQRQLRKELYGDDWTSRLAALQGDEDAINALKRKQKEEFDKRMRALLIAKKKKPEDLTQINEQDVQAINVKEEEKLCADWAKKEMDEDVWRKLSEKERQAIIMKTKLAQRQLQKEMYGADWINKIESLKGDNAAIEELKRNQRELFNQRLKAMILTKKTATHLSQIDDNEFKEVNSNLEEKLCADWVATEMNQGTDVKLLYSKFNK